MLPPAHNVRWLVAWQPDGCDVPLPAALQRDDITVVTQEGRGLSRNRNLALRHATGDVCVVADDDCRYTAEALQDVLQLFACHTTLDMALLRSLTHEGQPMKDYPTEPFDYAHRPRGYYVQSTDIAFRRSSISHSFDERFGIGAPLPGGEDELFVHSAWQQGLRVEYHPLTLCRTAAVTTGARIDTDPALLRAKGAVLAAMHGRMSATLRVMKYAATRGVALRPLLQGVWTNL